MCKNRCSGPTVSARDSRNAITSCFVTFSISAIRDTSILALFLIFADVPRGACPAFSNAAQACSSTSSQISYLCLRSQMAFICGRV